MKKQLFNIIVIFFTVIFITTSGGLFFILHHCRAHNHSVVTFFNEVKGQGCHEVEACCSGTTRGCCGDREAACSLNHEKTDPCCSERTVYLKVPFQFLQSDKKIIPEAHSFTIGALASPVMEAQDPYEAVIAPRYGVPWRASPPDISVTFSQLLI